MRALLTQLGPVARAQLPALLAALGLLVIAVVLIACGTPLWWFGASALVGAVLCV